MWACAYAEFAQAQEQLQLAEQKFQEASKKCLKPPITHKNAVQKSDCVDAAFQVEAQEINYPFMWLVDKKASANHDAAVAYAEGKKTRKEFAAQISINDTQFRQGALQAQQEAQQEAQQQQQQQLAKQAADQRQAHCMLIYSQALSQPTLGGSSMAALGNANAALLAAGCL